MNLIIDTPTGSYRWHEEWVVCPRGGLASAGGRTHGVAVDRDNNLYVFRQDVPAMLVYDSRGKLICAWGDYAGAHGLTLVEEDGEELLWLTDQDTGAVHKTTLNGKVLQSLDPPPYALLEKYVPTWVAVNEVRHGGNGDIWVADGYGSSRVNRYNASGVFLGSMDGTNGAGRFSCPHGVYFNAGTRRSELYVADRGNRRVQVFDSEGTFLRSLGEAFLTSPDGFVMAGDRMVIPELLGRVTVIDANDNVVAFLGKNDRAGRDKDPDWPNSNRIAAGMFSSPHAAAVDRDGSIYVVEWRVGGRVIKLERVS